LPAPRVTELAEDVVQLVRSSLPDVLQQVSRAGGARQMLDKLSASVLGTSNALAERLGMAPVEPQAATT
jgi:hypothetical protein